MLKLKINLAEFNNARLEKGWTIADVAKHAELTRQALYQITGGKNNASPKTAVKIAAVLGKTLTDIFTVTDQ